jgi:hypothetical protein
LEVIFDSEPTGSKEEREDRPAHAVIEVVDESSLRRREQIPVLAR